MSTLERAIAIAAEAHSGQVDKAGEPYVLHPLRVMLSVRTDQERIVAVLHDVVEDTPWTLEALRAEGFAEEVLEAVQLLTHEGAGSPAAEEDYLAYIQRASEHPIARAVKIADLRDNSDPARISAPTARDHERLGRYRRALQLLGA